MAKLTPQEIGRLNRYLKKAQEVGDKLEASVANALKATESMVEYKFLMVMMIMPEFVKIELVALIALADHKDELETKLKSKGGYIITDYNDKFDDMTLGQLINPFIKRYPEEFDLHDKLKDLTLRRNRAVHHIAIEYNGDLKKADDELRDYVVPEQKLSIINELHALFNRSASDGKVTELLKKLEEAKLYEVPPEAAVIKA
jgi:hypothetical protein